MLSKKVFPLSEDEIKKEHERVMKKPEYARKSDHGIFKYNSAKHIITDEIFPPGYFNYLNSIGTISAIENRFFNAAWRTCNPLQHFDQGLKKSTFTKITKDEYDRLDTKEIKNIFLYVLKMFLRMLEKNTNKLDAED